MAVRRGQLCSTDYSKCCRVACAMPNREWANAVTGISSEIDITGVHITLGWLFLVSARFGGALYVLHSMEISATSKQALKSARPRADSTTTTTTGHKQTSCHKATLTGLSETEIDHPVRTSRHLASMCGVAKDNSVASSQRCHSFCGLSGAALQSPSVWACWRRDACKGAPWPWLSKRTDALMEWELETTRAVAARTVDRGVKGAIKTALAAYIHHVILSPLRVSWEKRGR